jgi:2-hydroxychromene-2-carboxylate isomerase
MATIFFHFDLVCPFAYIAACRISALLGEAESPSIGCRAVDSEFECGSWKDKCEVNWVPTLLGGLYKLDNALQGKDGSATDVMSREKQVAIAIDLKRNAARFQVPLRFPAKHPMRTLHAMRLLYITPDALKMKVALALYRAYWNDNSDITDHTFLADMAARFQIDINQALEVESKVGLEASTKACSDAGAFGVPTFFVHKPGAPIAMFFGQDRIPQVCHAAGLNPDRKLVRYAVPRSLSFPRAHITFFYDIASPWTFLAHTQVRQLESVATIDCVPVLIGAIFKAVGTHNTPIVTFTNRKREWSSRDLMSWCEWWNEPLQWPSTFPLRSVLALRACIVEPRCRDVLFRAAWQHDVDIGKVSVLTNALNQAGFPAAQILSRANSDEVKAQLHLNTNLALEAGVFGLPAFQVELPSETSQTTKHLWWGQDRLDVILDACCGYPCPISDRYHFSDELATVQSKL